MGSGWNGTVQAFLSVDRSQWLAQLQQHYLQVTNEHPSSSQREAWIDSFAVLRTQLETVVASRPAASQWTCVFEYELPREGGRRPDLVILAGGRVLVLEFKEKELAAQGDIDQVRAYAQDLTHYHEGSHGRTVVPLLVPTKSYGVSQAVGNVLVVPPPHLSACLLEQTNGNDSDVIDATSWLHSDYAPLPSLVQAARHIFQHESLPYIKRAQAARIDDVIDYLVSVADRARKNQERHLVLVTGVPGAGKTLVGLKFVYEHFFGERDAQKEAVFLSGNGPLVDVLQHALQSRVFVQPMRNFIKQYGIGGRYPKEHVLVFDEAQRAWSADHVQAKHGTAASEPDLLIQVAERLPGWAMILGLVGEGQEIHIGEEAGIAQWNDAIAKGNASWHVHGPIKVRRSFPDAAPFVQQDILNLSASLRTHLAEDVQQWVHYLLDGEIDFAGRFADRIRLQGFQMYVTRSLDDAKRYVQDRYRGQPLKRFGLLASSKAFNLPDHGVDNSFQATQRLKVGPWYNDPMSSPLSCCQLTSVATEFSCQGLELDMPIVCWGSDVWWKNNKWESRLQPRSQAQNPHQLRLNSYRVLLSRGRDGFVVFLPPEAVLDNTYKVLLEAGVQELGEGTVSVAIN